MQTVERPDVRLIREHPDWVIVGKPPNLLIHPTRPDGQYTLLEWLKNRYPGEPVAIINRLDRETSGLVLVARTSEAASALGKMTMRREIRKRYLALVVGEPLPAGSILTRLDRQGKYRPSEIHLKQAVLEEGYPAVTRYTCVETRQDREGRGVSLVEVELETGRMHQIRVHLSHIGHPVLGDKIYGPDEKNYLRFIEGGWTEDLQKSLQLRRHALHSARLEFVWNNEPVVCLLPLWEDMLEFWDGLAFSPESENALTKS
ncbi:MAG: RNA pseudouridine synthase [Methylacidiphilales bacterium]|nr:RNA pseudouridine synthase [Candidatus Methylacidiphilales bacterium]